MATRRTFWKLACALGVAASIACGGDDTGGGTTGGAGGGCDQASDCPAFTCPGSPGEIRACIGGKCGTAADSCGGTGGAGGN